MSSLLFGQDELVADWVKSITGKQFHAPFTTIGLVGADGDFSGAFVFTGYNGDGIEVSVAGRAIVSRDAWRSVLNYVFDQLKCSRLQMHTRRSNKRVCRQLSAAFPKRCFEGISRRFYGREDAICYGLTVDDLPAFKAKWRL